MGKKINVIIIIMMALTIIPLVNSEIIIEGDTGYNATENFVSEQTNFNHLNISDPSILFYSSMDRNETPAGTLFDFTNYTNDFSIRNNVNWTGDSGGKIGAGYWFDGTNDYMTLGDNLEFNDDFSVSIWFKVDGINNGLQALMAKGTISPIAGYSLYINNKDIAVQVRDSTNTLVYITESNAISSSSFWYHAAFTFDDDSPTGLKLYVNGQDVGDTNPTALNGNYGSNREHTMGVAHRTTGFGFYLDGKLDEPMIINRTLTPTEVELIYNNSFPRFYETGNMTFSNVDLGGNSTVNVTIANCQTYNNSYLQGRFNSGAWENFSNCEMNDYSATGDLNNAEFQIGFNSADDTDGVTGSFYAPIIYGNITITPFGIPIPPGPSKSFIGLLYPGKSQGRFYPNQNLSVNYCKLGEDLDFT